MTPEDICRKLMEAESEAQIDEILKELENKVLVAVLDKDATVEYKVTETGDHLPVVHGHFHYELIDKEKDDA